MKVHPNVIGLQAVNAAKRLTRGPLGNWTGMLASRMQATSAHPLIFSHCRGIRYLMNRSVRLLNCKHMSRFSWAVGGVAR